MSTQNADILQRWNEWIEQSFSTKTEAARAFGESFNNFQRLLTGKRNAITYLRVRR